ncbi:MAG: hypothetical protein HQK53_17775 [Oligoflexia bacterium]|nr:hypothetical protein [Oligoflexia bacterium]
MEKVKYIDYLGVQILFIDFSNANVDEISIITEHAMLINKKSSTKVFAYFNQRERCYRI